MLIEEFSELGHGKGLGVEVAELMTRIRTLPVPIATEIGERLNVVSRGAASADGATWCYTITGTATNEEYGQITIDWIGGNSDDSFYQMVGLQLKMALHHPADLDDCDYQNWCQITGRETVLRCSTCGQGFVTYQETVSHERQSHGQDAEDRRPRIFS